MISRISLLKCKEGVSEEAFREGMMGDVRDVIARMPQLRKCEIDFVTDRQQRSHLGRGAIDIDGFIEMFFESYGDMQQAMDEVKMVVEGVYSAKAAIALAKKYGVDMPIIEEVNKVLFEDKPAKEAVNDLMLRDKKMEHGNLGWED